MESLLSLFYNSMFSSIITTNYFNQGVSPIQGSLTNMSFSLFKRATISSVCEVQEVDINQILLPNQPYFKSAQTSNKIAELSIIVWEKFEIKKIQNFNLLGQLCPNQQQYQMIKHFKTNLRNWLGKVYNHCKKPKKAVCDIAKKVSHIEPKQPKNIAQERIVDSLFEEFEELKSRDSTSEEGMLLIEQFIAQHQLAINQKLRENIGQHIQKFFAKGQLATKHYQQQVNNIWNNETFSYDCICPKATAKDLQFNELKQVCYQCGRTCHVNCLWGKDKKQQLYECPMCFLLNCLPNKEVNKIVFAGFLRQTKKDKIQYKINFPLQNSALSQELVQARCVRLCKDNRYELVWPMSCVLTLNSKKLGDFKPLNTNCALKKRTDDEINFDKKLLSNNNTLIIQERHQYVQGSRPAVYQNHLVVVLVAKTLNSQEIQKKVMNQKLNALQSKEILLRHFDRGIQDCVMIDKIKVTLRCQLYHSKIKIPVRSKHCTSHYQPFDLKTFLMANINVRSSSKRWKCHICGQRAHHLVVDSYLLNLILAKPKATDIEFDRQGQAFAIEPQNQSDNQQQKGLQIIQCENQQIIVSNQNQDTQKIAGNVNQYVQYEYIQIQSDQIQQLNQQSGKRAFADRKLDQIMDELKSKQPSKKLKNDNIQSNQKNPFHFMTAKEAVQVQLDSLSQQSVRSLSNVGSLQSKYSPNQPQTFKPPKMKKHRKQKVIYEDRKEFDKMSKTLIPSPAISTVIPQAIRILQKKMPQIPKNNINIELIEISEQEGMQSLQSRNAKKLQYHKQQLQKQKNLLVHTFGKMANFQITAADQSIFLSLCDKFINAPFKIV